MLFQLKVGSLSLRLTSIAMLLIVIPSCGLQERAQVTKASRSNGQQGRDLTKAEETMKIKVGTQTFSVALEDNPTVNKLKLLLPMTLDMTELNGNEKYYHLSSALPTDESKPGTIQIGDIMLYGDRSLVIFYKTFKTSYGYTRLGGVDDPTDLAAALGEGDVRVTFE